jgi:acyl-CoA reductase-like NAD-dependent aldehyde dehydrogenase
MNSFNTISPIDGSVYATRAIANSRAIEQALVVASLAQKAWKATSIAERATICRKAIQYFQENVTAIAEELTHQMGRPIRYTPFELKGGLKERGEYMISIAEEALADIQVPESKGFLRYIKREALGTVFVLAPWNYPYLTSVNAIIPALMAGNTVILKHAKQTPLCAERYAAAFEYAGLPAGVFQYLHLEHNQVSEIIKDHRIDYVAFTGSVGGGAAVQRAVGHRFIPAGLELGGKDPAYVRADAKLKNAIDNLVDGAFFNSGQSCCGIERIYVDQTIYQDFVEGFVEVTKGYQLGNPLERDITLGPMVRASAANYAQAQVEMAVKAGAKALIDPQLFVAHQAGTPYMAPQVLIDVNHQMEVMTEETFGPVVGIMPVAGDEEAIRLMNDSAYGLTASVWTQDEKRAAEIGRQVETGTFFMNRCDYLDPALAWTGVKNSGRGCTLSSLGYEALTRPKSFHLKMLNS